MVTTQEGCKISTFRYDPQYYFWTWSGSCANGYAQGYGQFTAYNRYTRDSNGKDIGYAHKFEPGLRVKLHSYGMTKDGVWISDILSVDYNPISIARQEFMTKNGRNFSLTYNSQGEFESCWDNDQNTKCANPGDIETQRTILKAELETRLKRQQSSKTAARDNYADDGDQPSKAGQASIANKESKAKLKGELANHCIEAEFVQTSTGEMSYFKNKCGYKVNYTWCVVNPPKESSSGMFRCKTGGVYYGQGADSIKPYGKSRVFLKGDRYYGYACKDPATPSVRYTGDGLKGGCR